MPTLQYSYLFQYFKHRLFLTGIILISFQLTGIAQNFSSATLDISGAGGKLNTPTTLQFGPDGKLYVALQDGTIKVFSVERISNTNYKANGSEDIKLIRNIPNHNDVGEIDNGNTKRQVTGLCVAGTVENPVIYVTSSDPRMGGGGVGDIDLCTNSGVVSEIKWNGSAWEKTDLVRGLPHSEYNHSLNGITYDNLNNRLLVAVGGFTNGGSPSKGFAFITEYALSAAIISIDLNVINPMPLKDAGGLNPYKYDMPTLDDPTRANNTDGSDINDPWGGNDGLNQAKIVPGGPVQVFARGFRNCFDVLITQSGNVYTIDNGGNPQWGGYPANEGGGNVTNEYLPNEPGSTSPGVNDPIINNMDGFHFIGNVNNYIVGSYYGGHPNPIRANPGGAGLYTHSGTADAGKGVLRTSTTDPNYPLPADWPPVPLEMAYPEEGDFQSPGIDDRSLLTFSSSTNGLCEYKSSVFNGAMQGNILACSYDGYINRIILNEGGNDVLNNKGAGKLNTEANFASGFGGKKPLDITAQGDDEVFPGTIWVALYTGDILVYEPVDGDIPCNGTNSPDLDEDFDQYTNADEILNGTNPCSGASKPEDFDGDYISDRADTDDDNDGIPDIQDYFAIDPDNGRKTEMPVNFQLYNGDPGTGFFGLGFTGLMSNGTSDYLDMYNSDKMVAGGAAGALTINEVSDGDAYNGNNSQQYAFQFGVKVNSNSERFIAETKLKGIFFDGNTPVNEQSQGSYVGTGDQDNYIKMALVANNGKGGIEVAIESEGVMESNIYPLNSIPQNGVTLRIFIDPKNSTARTFYAADEIPLTEVGSEVQLQGPIVQTLQNDEAVAVGIISTSRNSGTPFNATYDYIIVQPESISGTMPVAKKKALVSFFPNPTMDIVNLKSNSNNKITGIEMTDITGRPVLLSNPVQLSGKSGYEVNISNLLPGMYYLKVKFDNEEQEEVLKIIKK